MDENWLIGHRHPNMDDLREHEEALRIADPPACALRAEKVERSFALTLDRGGLPRTRVRRREDVLKRRFVHVAA